MGLSYRCTASSSAIDRSPRMLTQTPTGRLATERLTKWIVRKGWQRPELESSRHVLFAVGSHALPLVTERSWQRLNDYVWTQNSLRSSSPPGVSVRCGSIPMTRCRPSRVSCLAAFGLNGRAACRGARVLSSARAPHESYPDSCAVQRPASLGPSPSASAASTWLSAASQSSTS